MEKFKDTDCLISVNGKKENLCWVCERAEAQSHSFKNGLARQ